MVLLSALVALGVAAAAARAQLTIYSQIPLGHASSTDSADPANYTGSAAYDPTTLQAPALPNPMPNRQYTVAMQGDAASVTGLSIPHTGAFYGFSIEMSVINQVCAYTSVLLWLEAFAELAARLVGKNRYCRFHVLSFCALD